MHAILQRSRDAMCREAPRPTAARSQMSAKDIQKGRHRPHREHSCFFRRLAWTCLAISCIR